MDGVAAQALESFVVALAQGEQAAVAASVEVFPGIGVERLGQFGVGEFAQGFPQALGAVGRFVLALGLAVDGAAGFGNFRQVACAIARDEHGGARLLERGVDGRCPLLVRQLELAAQQAAEVGEHPVHTRVVELAGDGRVDRHILVAQLEGHAVALPLFAHVAQGVFGPTAVVLVEHDQLGVVDHVDLLELGGRPVVAGHHVEREVHQVNDFGIALADAGGFHHHQIKALRAQVGDAVLEHGVGGGVLAARGHAAHVHARAAQGVHADAIAQQGATAAAAGGVDGQHRNAHVWEGGEKADEQFVHHAGLARAAGAGEADHRCGGSGLEPAGPHGRQGRLAEPAFLDGREGLRDGHVVGLGHVQRLACGRLAMRCCAGDEVVNHPHQAELGAVVGVVDALHALGLQGGNFLGRDGAAAAAEDADVARAALGQHLHHIAKKFRVAALVARQGNAVGVFLDGGADDVFHAAVMAEVHHFRALCLYQAAHHIDGRVVAVEEAGGGDEAQRCLGAGKVVGGGGRLHLAHGALLDFDGI